MLYALLGSNAIMILSFVLRYKTFPLRYLYFILIQ